MLDDMNVKTEASSSLSVVERLKLVMELSAIRREVTAATLTALDKLKKLMRLGQIRTLLIGSVPPEKWGESKPSNSSDIDSSKFYDYDENRKQSQRKKDNKAAIDLLNQIQKGDVEAQNLTDEHRSILAKYSGTGGALIGADGKKGSAYEYYTPKPIAEGIWDLLKEIGFSGGKVLDPCAGTGIFGATAPSSALVDTIELNETSGLVNKYVNERPGYTAIVSPFEKVASNTPDGEYDAVVTNVPFGGVADRGGNQLLDPKYQKEPLQNYFILRSLEKLRGGGLAAFITPPRCVSGKGQKEEELRLKSSYMAEFLGAYRLPNSVFGTASADTITDVMFYKKYSDETIAKIEELKQQNPQVLIDAGVLWQDFVNGKYFESEGKRFVLGEFVPKDPNKIRDVDRVVNPLAVPDIAKLMRKFGGGSRVNWELLNTTETDLIVYQNGDTKTQAGQTLQYEDGVWKVIANQSEYSVFEALVPKLSSPVVAFTAEVTYDQANDYINHMHNTSRHLDIPDWIKLVMREKKAKDNWKTALVSLSVAQVLDAHSHDSEFNYFEQYPELSLAMEYQSRSKSFKPKGDDLKRAFKLLQIHYGKTGFSPVWKGEVQQEVQIDHLLDDHSFEGLRYKNKTHWVSLDEMKALYGDDFNPLAADNDWCVSDDGLNVTKAADYYIGNYQDFIIRIDDAISKASGDLKDKLLKQKIDANKHLDIVNAKDLDFNLFSPHVSVEEKAEFLRRYVSEYAHVSYDDKTGKSWPDIDIKGSNLSDRDKLLNRVGDYMKNGSITLGGAKLSMSDEEALHELRKIVVRANEQFNSWAKGNKVIVDRIQQKANDPRKLRFKTVEDDVSILQIPGMNPAMKLHSYQAAYVLQQGREFGGGNAFDVGLGKTFTALASIQHVQSMGVKKKTIIVVPNSVLSNWKKEASSVYSNIDDCLFVGLRLDKSGKPKVDTSKVDEDLHLIQQNKHSKIFMTLEQFQRIRLKEETIANYDIYMRQVDASFAESQDKKQDERNKSKLKGITSILADKKGAAPYLEDLGVDSIVIDEAHVFKNSSETVNFKSAKFLSLSEAAKRGIDAQAKAWYIRDRSPLKDGVLLLTATPITNSPLEIYSMLTLAVGHERINDSLLGIKGADDFMNMVCRKENQDDMTMDGVMRTTDVFVGLDNVNALRSSIKSVFTIKNADDVGASIIVPEADESSAGVQLPDDVTERLNTYKQAFRFAIDSVSKAPVNRGSLEAFEEVSEHFGEPIGLIAHPFNLISKMTRLIADPELDQRATFFYIQEGDKEKAQKVISEFNVQKNKEERSRPSPYTKEEAIVGKTVKKEAGEDTELVVVEVLAGLVDADNKIWVDTIDPETQFKFEAIATKHGLDMDVTIPPKIAAMLENYNMEKSNPRGVDSKGNVSPIVKQLIFCDILPLHSKIRRILVKKGSTPSGKIAIITGKTNNKPEEIIDVQDGFNAEDDDNKYQTVIANEKAEVGINLQKGTQAIHHLTVGWTPDSLTQRNGRGVRQGNKTERVKVYFYDADGTFDVFKRTMVNRKQDWISSVVNEDGGNAVDISGGLSKEQMEALISAVGDAEAMKTLQENADIKEAEARARTNRERQVYNLDIISKSRKYIKDNDSPDGLIKQKIKSVAALMAQAKLLKQKISNPKASETAVARNEALLSELEVKIDTLKSTINKSALFYRWNKDQTFDLDTALEKMRSGYRFRENRINEFIDSDISFHAVDDSPLFNDWKYEIDMAESMIRESASKALEQANAKGAYNQETISRFVERGDGLIDTSGKLLLLGMFMRHPQGIAVFSDSAAYRYYSRSGDTFYKPDGETFYADPSHSSVLLVYPGQPEYEQCLIDAAAIEDGMAEKGLGASSMPFSNTNKDVLRYRKTEDIVDYLIDSFMIGHAIPYVVVDCNTPVSSSIAEKQKSIVLRVSGAVSNSSYHGYNGSFKAKSSTPVTPYDKGSMSFMKDRFKAMIDYAKANNLKLKSSDVGGYSILEDYFNIEEITEFVNSLEDVSESIEFVNAVKQGLINKFTWFDFDGVDPVDLLSLAQRKQINTLVGEVMAKKGVAGAVSVGGPDDLIGLSGNTYKWKNEIKATAQRMGTMAKWHKDSTTWRVPRKVYLALSDEYSDFANDIEVIEL